MSRSDTIVALASGQGRSAIAVVRVSGPGTEAAVRSLALRLPQPRQATLCRLADVRNGDPIDQALVLWFPAPHSFTGEDCAEFHVHGGRSVIAGLLDALTVGCGLRLAEPGEFARRAFENGKLDLTKVEALADLINAETAMQRRQALRQLGGALSRKVDDWRDRLIKASAWAEAVLDFSDEGDVDLRAMSIAMGDVARLLAEVRLVLDENGSGERLRDGLVVVIAGPPNAGKSTLLNYLARREAAIVSPYAGTTRDVLELQLDVLGWPVTLIDTAGIRDSSDPIEVEGIGRARQRISNADLLLWLSEEGHESSPESDVSVEIVRVISKSDLPADSPPKHGEDFVNVSAHTGFGMDLLLRLIASRASKLVGGESAILTRERHRIALKRVAENLDSALSLFAVSADDELVAEELRLAGRNLAQVSGRIDVEEVLGALFSGFCIGK